MEILFTSLGFNLEEEMIIVKNQAGEANYLWLSKLRDTLDDSCRQRFLKELMRELGWT